MDDPALPGAAQLLGPQAPVLLARTVEGAQGQVLRARPTQVRYDPGRRLTVRYAARVQWPAGERTETLGALIDAAGPPPGVEVVEAEGAIVGVWRYPHDPCLPGLPHAAYPHGVRQVLRAMGLPAEAPRIAPLVYRPCRRAVLRVLRTGDHELYFKVVPPTETAPLRAVHDAFTRTTPAARCLAWADDRGLLVLPALSGVPLTRVLLDGGPLPAPTAIAALVRAIRAVELPPECRGRAADVGWYAQLLRRAVPGSASLIDDLAGAATGRTLPAETTTHGDLYPAQLLIDGGAVTGLLDLDGSRIGSVVDDPASLVAHLLALAHVRPAAAARIHAYRRELQPLLAAQVDPAAFAAAVTGVLLGLATTPFRRQEPDWRARTVAWLELARTWSPAAPADAFVAVTAGT